MFIREVRYMIQYLYQPFLKFKLTTAVAQHPMPNALYTSSPSVELFEKKLCLVNRFIVFKNVLN